MDLNISEITLSQVARVYSGRAGCMCGCRGKYTESGRGVALIFNKIVRNPAAQYDEHARCVYVETPTRNQVAYLR